MNRTRWEVCTIAQEAPDLLVAWAAHHLDLGANRIHLFLDQPNPGAERILARHPRIDVHVCDLTFWERHPNAWVRDHRGPRPPRIGLRQRAVLQHVTDTSDADWVFHIDSDEFLVKGDVTPSEALAAVPDHAEHARVLVSERVYLAEPAPDNILDGVFRMLGDPKSQGLADASDGDAAEFLHKGMTGYAGVKSAFKARTGVPVGVHGPNPPKPETCAMLDGLHLLHFDGLTPKHWTGKRLRLRKSEPNVMKHERDFRVRQFEELLAQQDDPRALRAFYLKLKLYQPARAKALDDLGLILRPDFDPSQSVRNEFPEIEIDLSETRFDSFSIV